MNFTRTDANSLLAVAFGGMVGIAALGPQHWGTDTPLVRVERVEPVTIVSTSVAGPAVPGNTPTIQLSEGVLDESAAIAGEHAVAPTEPLVYLDGIRIFDGLPDIDPNTIERVEVIKGEAALELYGPAASGGVVQIFSKDLPSRDPGG